MTATTAEHDTHTDTIEHLDWQPACDVTNCRTGHPPATHIINLRCGCTSLACNGCTKATKEALKRNWHAEIATCRKCGREYRNVTTRQLYVSIKPL